MYHGMKYSFILSKIYFHKYSYKKVFFMHKKGILDNQESLQLPWVVAIVIRHLRNCKYHQ